MRSQKRVPVLNTGGGAGEWSESSAQRALQLHRSRIQHHVPERVAFPRSLRLRQDRVRVIPFPQALAIKLVFDRNIVAGDPGDKDVYGTQQHRLLLGVEL